MGLELIWELAWPWVQSVTRLYSLGVRNGWLAVPASVNVTIIDNTIIIAIDRTKNKIIIHNYMYVSMFKHLMKCYHKILFIFTMTNQQTEYDQKCLR